MASSMGDINATVGGFFEVRLDSSQSASTGFRWVLSHMPDCVNLLDVRHESASSAMTGSRSEFVFVFVAVKEDQSFLKFQKIRPTQPANVVDKKIFALIIKPAAKTVEQDLEDTIGCGKFVSGASAQNEWGPLSPVNALYMAPRKCAPTVATMPYGFPFRVVHHEEQCLLAYGTPHGLATAGEECLLKYGFPVSFGEQADDCHVKYGMPHVKYGVPVVKYGFPLPGGEERGDCVVKYGVPAMKYGFPIHIREDAENCLLKYGCPVEILEDQENCVLKYGIPEAMAERHDPCLVKYGMPVHVREAAEGEQCVVKYGIPTGIARDADSCLLKYGFPVAAEEHENCLLKYGIPPESTTK